MRSAGDAIAASGPSIAALFELDRHRCTPAHAREEKGQGLSGHAHATNERLVERLRFEHYW